MQTKAKVNNIRISARKARLVADLVRNKNVKDAMNILKFTNKKVAPIMLKVLKSAQANAVNNFNMNEEELYISQIFVNEGSIMKRLRPRAMGRADIIHKKSSHITIEVSDRN